MPRTLTNTAPEAAALGDPLDLWRQFIAVDDELRTIRMFDSPQYLIERRDAIVAQARCVVEAE